MGTPLTKLSSTNTKTGEMSVANCQPWSTGAAMMAMPSHKGDLAEVVRVAAPRPQPDVDEPAVVGRIGPECGFLSVGGDLDGESDDPDDETDDAHDAEVLLGSRRHGGKGRTGGEGDPQTLDHPRHERSARSRP